MDTNNTEREGGQKTMTVHTVVRLLPQEGDKSVNNIFFGLMRLKGTFKTAVHERILFDRFPLQQIFYFSDLLN